MHIIQFDYGVGTESRGQNEHRAAVAYVIVIAVVLNNASFISVAILSYSN